MLRVALRRPGYRGRDPVRKRDEELGRYGLARALAGASYRRGEGLKVFGLEVRRAREARESQPFTDAVVSALVSQASSTAASSSATAALETAAGTVARAFAAASISPENFRTRAITPSVLGLIGRELIRRGEALFAIEVTPAGLELRPAGSWDVRGSSDDPASWMYRLDLFAPSGNRSRFVPASGVVHTRLSFDPARPWAGIAPLQWAKLSGTLHANLEDALGDEAGGTRGHLLPIPAEPGDDEDESNPLGPLVSQLARLKGQTRIVETTAAGYGEGREAAPRKDFEPKRIGADPPEALARLREDSGSSVLAACGVPPELIRRSDGTAQRESYRRFLHGTLAPMGRIVAQELRAKLEVPELALGFNRLFASDLTGRARAFQSLVKAGMEIERSASLAGLLLEEEEGV